MFFFFNDTATTEIYTLSLHRRSSDLAEPGTEVEVNIYGALHKAVVQPDQPLWDPDNERKIGRAHV